MAPISAADAEVEVAEVAAEAEEEGAADGESSGGGTPYGGLSVCGRLLEMYVLLIFPDEFVRDYWSMSRACGRDVCVSSSVSVA